MKYLLTVFVFLLMFIGCDDASPSKSDSDITAPDTETVTDADEVTDAEVDEENDADETIDTEVDADSENSDTDFIAECEEGETKNINCGLNNAGTQSQVCKDGKWIDNDNCNDPDECTNDDTHAVEGTVSSCIDGKWKFIRKTVQFGTRSSDEGKSVAVDSLGNIYVAGVTCGDLDGNTDAGLYDIFLTKFNSSGVKQWTKQYGTLTVDYGISIAVDSNGNIYVAGYTYGAFDGYTNAGSYDIFLTKFSSSGEKQWTKQYGTSVSEKVSSVAVDSLDNIYVTGYTSGSFDGYTNAGSNDIFLTKFSSDGTKEWTQQYGTSSNDYGQSIAVESSDNIYVAGYTDGSFDGNTNAGSNDIFLTKFNSSGVKEWTKQYGSSLNDYGQSIAIDSSDNIYIGGYTDGSLDGNTNAGGRDVFLIKFNSFGTKVWNKQYGTGAADSGYSVAVDSLDNICITGTTSGTLDGNTNAGDYDVFLSIIPAE